jgi:hypothetical protein
VDHQAWLVVGVAGVRHGQVDGGWLARQPPQRPAEAWLTVAPSPAYRRAACNSDCVGIGPLNAM